jgi:NAD(P)H-dependent FMN reductase
MSASPPKILALAGSARSGSFNRLTLAVAVEGLQSAGAEVTEIDLNDYPLPIYNGDLEASEGLPENAAKLQQIFAEQDGFVFASPEYNASVTPLLKNTIDWISRTPENGPEPFDGKVAALVSASPGGLGGMRGLTHLRAILGNLGVLVLPGQVSVSAAFDAFDDNGQLKQERKAKQLHGLAATLVDAARRWQS